MAASLELRALTGETEEEEPGARGGLASPCKRERRSVQRGAKRKLWLYREEGYCKMASLPQRFWPKLETIPSFRLPDLVPSSLSILVPVAVLFRAASAGFVLT